MKVRREVFPDKHHLCTRYNQNCTISTNKFTSPYRDANIMDTKIAISTFCAMKLKIICVNEKVGREVFPDKPEHDT